MKFCVCPDSFKGTLTSVQVCESFKRGILNASAKNKQEEIIFDDCPMSDGGKGFLASSVAALQNTSSSFELVEVETVDPYFSAEGDYKKKNKSKFGFDERKSTKENQQEDLFEIICVVETAEACGIHHLPPSGKDQDRNPLDATTFGVGELLKAVFAKIESCMNREEKRVYSSVKILIGLGGSATNDCGVGCLQALGCSFFVSNDEEEEEEEETKILAAKDLVNIKKTKLEKMNLFLQNQIRKIYSRCSNKFEVVLVSDVTNPLLGPQGATAIYGPQKGARSVERQEFLESALTHAHKILTESDSLENLSFSTTPGAGAAGGLGGALLFAFRSAGFSNNIQILPGAETFAEIAQLERRIRDESTTFVVSGEGSLDAQTILYGKTVAFIAALCKKYKKPLVILCGLCDEVAAAEARSCRDPPMFVFDTVSKFGKELSLAEPAKCLEKLCEEEVYGKLF
jgi:glycerate kinase